MAELIDLATTAAGNTDRFPENMQFRQVNDAARELEAMIAREYRDRNCSINASGSSSAFAITTNQTITSYADNQVFGFTANHTITGAATLDVNGLGARSITAQDGSPLGRNDIVAGQKVLVIGRAATSTFQILGGRVAGSSADVLARIIRAGSIMAWASEALPTGWEWCDGAAISRAANAELFAAIGTLYGDGDSSTTFNLPDYRGEFLRGWANGSSKDPDRALRTNRGDGTTGDRIGTKQDGKFLSHAHTVSATGSGATDSQGSHTHQLAQNVYDTGNGFGGFPGFDGSGTSANVVSSTQAAGAHTHTVSLSVSGTAAATGGTETRPRNVAVGWIILARPAQASAATLGLAGLSYTWDTGTTAADPGVGKMRVNASTIASATAIYISDTDGYNAPVGPVIQSFPINTRLHIFKVGDPGTFAQFAMGATATPDGAYNRILSLTYVGGSGTFALGDAIAVVPFLAGATGTAGAAGDGGIRWTFDPSTTMADPGAGEVRLNNASVASVTELAISALTGETGNPDFSTWIESWDDSTTVSDRGQIILRTVGGSAQAVFSVNGPVTDNTDWLQVPVAHVASAGTLSGTVYVSFARSGDAGAGSGDVSAGANFGSDNRLLRSDGALKRVQASPLTVDDTGNVSGVGTLSMSGGLTMDEIATPATPASGKVALYPKSDGRLYIRNDTGAETDLKASDLVSRAAFSTAQAAADAAAGQFLYLQKGDSVTLQVPSQFATYQAALDACARWWIPAEATVTIQVTGHVTTSGRIGLLNHPCSDRIKTRGTPAVDTSFTAVTAVTGAAGEWSVTTTVPDPSLIDVGDVVMVRDVTPGVKAPGEYVGYPTRGELRLAFFALSSSNRAYIKTVGTAATVWTDAAGTIPADLVSTFIQSGDIVVIAGQVRRATAPTASGFTLSSALQVDVSGGRQYWYHLSRSGQGSITIAGGVVTGNTTLFASQYQVGDYIFIADSGAARITAITAETGAGCITLDRTLPNVTTKSYGCMIRGQLHEGSWLVTAKSGSSVTWINTGQTVKSQPPVRGGAGTTIAGTIRVLKSSLRTTGATSGLLVQAATLDLDHIAIVGSGAVSSASVGIDLRGADQNTPPHPAALAFLPGHTKCGTRTAILNWGYGAWLQNSSLAVMDYAMITGSTVRGLNCNFGGKIELKGAVIAGNAGLGILVGPGAFMQWSDTRFNGNGDDAVRNIIGRHYAEFPHMCANGGDGIAIDDAVNCHHNGGYYIDNPEAVGSDNGGYGRMTGSLIIGSAVGVSLTNAQIELSQCTMMACGAAVIANNSRLDCDDIGIGNCGTGIRTLAAARVIARMATVTDTATALLAEETSEVIAPGVALGGGAVSATGEGSEIWIKGYRNPGTFNPATLNRRDTNWNVVTAGSDVSTVPLYPSIEIGGILTITEVAAPATPASGKVALYPKTDGKIYLKDDSGAETDLTAVGALSVVVKTFSADGTYTPTANMIYCIVEAVGGGGGGSGSTGSASHLTAGGCGGGGEYVRSPFSAASIGASKAVVIGGGGTGGSAGGTGGVGQDTTLGATLLVAKGGSNGVAGSSSVFGSPGNGGTGGTGQIKIAGMVGTFAPYSSGVSNLVLAGSSGGHSYLGSAARPIASPAATATSGSAASANSGGGGSGGMSNFVVTNAAGGAGGSGRMIITEFIA